MQSKSRFLVIVCLLCVISSGRANEPSRPNIILILADDLGYADVGFHGSRDVPTPNLDRLAKSGVRCTSGYSSHPYCSPMRAGMMTGKYQHRFGYERNIAYDPQNQFMGLPQSEPTIATRMQQAGYTTGMLGKWHLGAARQFHPNHRGYDHFFGFLGGGHQYFEVDLTRDLGEGYFNTLQRNGKPVDLTDYITTAITDEATSFIESHRSEPFFLFVAYNAPHGPLQAPQGRIDELSSITDKRRRTYAAMVSLLDDGVGRVVECLETLDLRDKTLLFFLSDNGGPENANASLNDPLRGQKGDVYEGGIRVPFVASWPGRLPSETIYHHPVNSIDISCTAMSLAGIDLKAEKLDGTSLVPYLDGTIATAPHEAIFWRKENGQEWAVRSGNMKLLADHRRSSVPELYDLDADLSETTDLAAEQPKTVTRLRSLYEQWNAGNQPPFFVGYRQYHQLMDEKYREVNQQAALPLAR